MTTQPTHKEYGHTDTEQFAMFAAEIEFDAVGLWSIVSTARNSFNLEGKAREDFVYSSIMAILKAGGRPVLGSIKKDGWVEQTKYGVAAEEISKQIIFELMSKNFLVDHGDIWFAAPALIQQN
jgi:hypothetical protein